MFFVSSPSKVQQKFLEALGKEDGVLFSSFPSEFIDTITSESMHWWVDVTECKLVCRNLSTWRHVRLAEEQQ